MDAWHWLYGLFKILQITNKNPDTLKINSRLFINALSEAANQKQSNTGAPFLTLGVPCMNYAKTNLDPYRKKGRMVNVRRAARSKGRVCSTLLQHVKPQPNVDDTL